MHFEDIHEGVEGNPPHEEAAVGALIAGFLHLARGKSHRNPDKVKHLAGKLLGALRAHREEWGDS